MHGRFIACALLLITAIGCGQSSAPNTTAPSSSNCTFGLSTGTTINGYPNGGSFTMGVTASATSGCTWTASSQASWIHVPDGESGNGSGAFTFTVDANPGAARAGTLTVAGQIVVFNQTAVAVTVGPTPACTYALSIGPMINGYPTGGTFAAAVTTTPSTGCDWTAVSNADWIHITSGSSGSGNGSFTFVADSNPGPARAGTLTAANEIVVFNQSSASGQ
jgi:hypothetical protein